MENPKYLYHYTSIETLALILESKKIRFNRLDNVDDLEEAETSDLGNLGRYCFVSCWTEDKEESIPFWGMYTRDMKGVRIKMPSDMFKTYEVHQTDARVSVKTEKFSKFKPSEIFRQDTLISPPWDNILTKVEYTNDNKLIYPKIIDTNRENESGKLYLKFDMLVKYKRQHWAFQNEWRFKFNIVPISRLDKEKGNYIKFINHLKDNMNLDIDCYFLDIDETKLKEMEIIVGPNTTEAEKIIVEALIKKFNPDAKVFDSSLKNKIKPK